MKKQNKRSSRRKSLGQGMVEYFVACIIVLVMLGATFVGGDGESVIDFFLEKTEESYDKLSSSLAVPI